MNLLENFNGLMDLAEGKKKRKYNDADRSGFSHDRFNQVLDKLGDKEKAAAEKWIEDEKTKLAKEGLKGFHLSIKAKSGWLAKGKPGHEHYDTVVWTKKNKKDKAA